MELRISENPEYKIVSDNFFIDAKIKSPEIESEQPITLKFQHPYRNKSKIGDIKGVMQGDISVSQGIELTREFFTSHEADYIAVRLKIKNKREKSINLKHLYPIAICGDNSLKINNRGISDWRIMRTCRQKNDVPGTFSITEMDENLEDAAFNAKYVKAGGGIAGQQEDFLDFENFVAEPFFYIKDKLNEKTPGVFFGVIGQTEHLTSFYIKTSKCNKKLNEIICDCEFDGIRIDPDEERETHWILITPVIDEVMIREDFTEIFMKEFDISKPEKDHLTVFCTWQFYGFDFLPEDLDENLEYLKKRGVPIDVLQLDNGWIDSFGDWNANYRFPKGMKHIADKISEAGYMPGIWTCPFIIMEKSEMFKEHPELVAKTSEGDRVEYAYRDEVTYAIDPTVPYYEKYLTDMYKKLVSWGYKYHKLDFMRAVIINDNVRFYDKKANRAQAYLKGNQIIREALGDECYMASCGGINDAINAGIVDSLRTGQDTYSYWVPPDGSRWKGTQIKLKQNLIRNYTNLLWSVDADAASVRRRKEVFRKGVVHSDLSQGLFTDEEAFSISLNQYLCGGNVCISERFAEIDDERLSLLRHFVPSGGVFAKILDYSTKRCPNYFLTEITPKVKKLDKWWTLAVGNWHEENRELEIDLAALNLPEEISELVVFEFHDQKFYGAKNRESKITINIPPHGMRLFRLAEWNGKNPVIVGTDLHFSGGLEISSIEISKDEITGSIETNWKYPVKIYAAFAHGPDIKIVSDTVKENARDFCLKCL